MTQHLSIAEAQTRTLLLSDQLEDIRNWCTTQYADIDRMTCDDYAAGQFDALELLVAMIDGGHFYTDL